MANAQEALDILSGGRVNLVTWFNKSRFGCFFCLSRFTQVDGNAIQNMNDDDLVICEGQWEKERRRGEDKVIG